MPVAIDPASTWEYSLKGDTTGTVFTLGVIDSSTRRHIDDKHLKIDADGKTRKMTEEQLHDKYWMFAQFGLRGWRGFKDSKGQEVPFKTASIDFGGVRRTVVSDESLNFLDLKWIVELGISITQGNRLLEQDEKN